MLEIMQLVLSIVEKLIAALAKSKEHMNTVERKVDSNAALMK